MPKYRKPQLKVGQLWSFQDQIVRVTRWGQDGGGRGEVHFVEVGDEPWEECCMSGQGFRRQYSPVIDARPIA